MSRPVIGANYAGWNSANYPVSAIPADGITHLFYAFATIENGEYVVDRRNMTLLSQEFRRRLDQRDRRVKLSAALPAGRLQTDGPYDPAVSFENPLPSASGRSTRHAADCAARSCGNCPTTTPSTRCSRPCRRRSSAEVTRVRSCAGSRPT
jgi:hypothetical protein